MLNTYSNWDHLLGASSALLSAFSWAVAAILFARIGKTINARALNLGKGIVAIVCLSLLLLISSFPDYAPPAFWYLALSGVLGIAIGDTLYFYTLQRLGAKVTLLVGTLIPVVTAIAAIIIFEEKLNFMSVVGLILTVGGVTFVLWYKLENKAISPVWLSGIIIAVLYVLTESGGILLTKFGLNAYDSIEATFIRQAWGIAALVFWGLSMKSLVSDFSPIRNNPRLLKLLIFTSFIGAFVGTWLSVLALELTYTAIAVPLNSTSPLFILPISYWFLKEKISRNEIFGALFATIGVGIVFFSLS